MRIEGLAIEGLRHAPGWTWDGLGASVALPAPPVGIAISDGLALVVAALDASRADGILEKRGLRGPEAELLLDDHGMPEQVVGLDPIEVEALLDPSAGRKVVVQLDIALDPPLFGQLREESMRDPRMLAALGEDPTVQIRVGWLFSADHSAASIGVLELKVADTAFPTGRNERARWIDPLLKGLGTRIGHVGRTRSTTEVTARLLQASLSPDPALRARYARLREAMALAPFDLGRLELVGQPDALQPCFGEDLVRVRQLGPRALRALRVASAALLDAPDVLVVEDGAAAPWSDWLEGLTEGDDATLEQVFWLHDGEIR